MSAVPELPTGAVRVALVNNMPSAALTDTEEHFSRLLGDALGGRPLDLALYRLGSVPCTGAATARVAAAYRPLAGLWADVPDVVVVTGAEPLAGRITDEPYWGDLEVLLDAIAGHTVPTILSCLSAHAAMAVYDGLERRPLSAKCSGVFVHAVAQRARSGPDGLPGLPGEAVLPHSRTNEIPVATLRGAGWEPLLTSTIGWGAAECRRSGGPPLLALQGHPEYAGTTLLKEWRRDLTRYVRGERADLQAPPHGAVAPADQSALVALADAAGHGDTGEVARFAWDQVAARAPTPWREPAALLCRGWLAGAWRVGDDALAQGA